MTPEVSVVIAAYNNEGSIERAVRSALEWQGAAVEVIVVNDASTDATAEIVTRIDDARVKLLNLRENHGPGGARNFGFELATAPWIAILDADDAFLPDRLMRCLTRAKALDADIVVDNIDIYREADGAMYPMFNPPRFARLMLLELGTFINGNCSFLGGGEALGYLKPVFKADFLRRFGLRYDTELRIGEDYIMMCDALASGARCAVEPTAGYLYTIRAGSISHRLTPADVERIDAADKKFLARHKLPASAALAQKRREKALTEALAFTKLVDAIKSRDWKGAVQAFAECPPAARHLWRAVWVRIKKLPGHIKFARQPQNPISEKTILLFYKEQEADKFFKYDRYLKRIVRPFYERLHTRQKKTGFAMWLDLLRRALTKAGYDVRINDYRTARQNPAYPVGAVGFPVLLKHWTLPNPAILGPSLYDHPMLAPGLFKDTRFKKYAVVAPWNMDMFRPVYGNACFSWFAGIDLEEWPDLSGQNKTYDFLIYDKIRWHHDALENSFLRPLFGILNKKNLSYRVVRYKMYDHATYKKLLAEARGMIFLCEHETQGMAYQEAMASNVPVLAWDAGFWADPMWRRFGDAPPPASSVPYFSPECGETFRDLQEFPAALERFMQKRDGYTPRQYVAKNLDMETSARLYAEQYFSLIAAPAETRKEAA